MPSKERDIMYQLLDKLVSHNPDKYCSITIDFHSHIDCDGKRLPTEIEIWLYVKGHQPMKFPSFSDLVDYFSLMDKDDVMAVSKYLNGVDNNGRILR